MSPSATALKTEPTQTPSLIRAWRLARFCLQFLRGFAILIFHYRGRPREHQADTARRWSRGVLAALSLELRITGTPPQGFPRNTLVVSNHVSWLDIIALACCTPPLFVAKKEIRGWPVVGWMVARGGTLFIDRTNRRDASRVNHHMAEALAGGECLCVFPEGTTTTGHELLPFKSSLFESAVLAGSTVQPVAIRYLDEHGRITSAPSYAGDTTFWQSLGLLLRQRRIVVELHYCQPLPAGGNALATRFELSEAARGEIAAGLRQLPDRRGTAEKTVADPQAAVQ